MQLETAIKRLDILVGQLSATTTASSDLSEAWTEIDDLLKSVISPAIKSGGSLPLEKETKVRIGNLISEIAALEQKLQIKARALDTFVPRKNSADPV
ncbi:hypothetical protein [Nereida sp.]|uniref:hypothetical protein n=1 Tax=Nereida sp. TaxID=2736090 RepID=UPI003F6A4430